MAMFIFFVFDHNYHFWGKIWFKNSKLFVEAEIQQLDWLERVEFDGNFSFFPLFWSEIPVLG